MKADLRGKHDLGGIVGYAYRIYLTNFRELFSIALVMAPLAMLSVVIERRLDDPDTALAVNSLFQIPQALVALVAAAALITAVHEITGDTAPSPGAALDAGFQRFGAMFKTALLVGILVVASIVSWPWLAIWWLFRRHAAIGGRRDWWLVLVPFALPIYLALRWGFFQQAIVLEDKRNWAALDSSAGGVRDNWWRVAGILLVVALIQLGPFLLAQASTLAAPLIEATVTALVSALILPFAVIAQTLLYYDLKARSAPDVSPA